MIKTNNNITNLTKRNPQLIIFVAAFSAFLATFNETYLNVAFSPIMSDLGVSISTVQWLATAYMLGAAIMVPVSAFLYKNIPTKILYLITVGFLILGSVIGAFSLNFQVLLIGRIIQALGTGMLIPIGMNITLEVAPKQKLGTYMGIMGAMTTLGPSSSVIVAGLLLTFFDWHVLLWVFAILSIICFVCGLFFLNNIAELTHPKLDIVSTILIGLSLISILYGISTIFSGYIPVAIISAVIGIVLLILFISRQNKLDEPLINLHPLAVKPFAIGVILNMICLIIIFAMNIVMPLFMQNVLHASAFGASITLFPAIVLSCLVSPIAGKIYDKNGEKLLLPLGFIFIGIFTLFLSLAQNTGSLIILSILYIPVICGSALIIGPVQSYSLSYLTQEENPHGVTIMSTGFQIAGCIGSSLFTGIYSISSVPNNGFVFSSISATVFAIVGLYFTLYIRRFDKVSNHNSLPIHRLETIGIASFMKNDIYCVSVDNTVLDALKCMNDNKTSGLPVVDSYGYVCGFISDGDIIRFMLGSSSKTTNFASMYPLWNNTQALDGHLSELDKINVMEVATHKIISVELSNDVKDIFKVISDKKVKKVPVLNNGKIVGTASKSDLLRELIARSSFVQTSNK